MGMYKNNGTPRGPHEVTVTLTEDEWRSILSIFKSKYRGERQMLSSIEDNVIVDLDDIIGQAVVRYANDTKANETVVD